jgi:hypothetical protein
MMQFISTLLNFVSELYGRWNQPTPKWFRHIAFVNLILSAVSGSLILGQTAGQINLHHYSNIIWIVFITSLSIAALSKTAVKNDSDK